MTTINSAFPLLFDGPLSRVDRDASASAKYVRQLAQIVSANHKTWPAETRLLTDETRARLLATLQRVNELNEALMMIVALGTPPA